MKISEILKSAKKIAIVGLSPDPQKDSNHVGAYLQNVGYEIYPIYPKMDEILGRKVYRSIADLPEKMDIIVMFRKGEFASEIYPQVRENGAGTFWLQLGIKNESVANLAQKDGLNFVQDRCIMIEHKFNLKD